MAGGKRRSVDDNKGQSGKRLNVVLRGDAATRLMLHCVMLGRNPGDLISDLVDSNLREFRVQRNPSARATQGVSADSADPVDEMQAEAA